MNLPMIFKKKNLPSILTKVKENAMKSDGAILDTLSKRLEGNKMCPFMMGHPCVGNLCMMWQKYFTKNLQTGETVEYERCSVAQLSNLLLETNSFLSKTKES